LIDGRHQNVCAGPAGVGAEDEQVGGKSFLWMIYEYQRRKDFHPTCCVRDFCIQIREENKGGEKELQSFLFRAPSLCPVSSYCPQTEGRIIMARGDLID
jgi:hypothetical protein